MLFVFFILFIVILIALLTFMIILSTLEIEIYNLSFDSTEKQKNNEKLFLKILLRIGKFKWLAYKLNKEKLIRMKEKAESKVDIKQLEREIPFNKEGIEYIKALHLGVKSISLEVGIGVEDVILTSYLVAIISGSISLVLPHMIKKINKDNHYYRILPIYQNKNLYKITLDCIINAKMVHIISVIYNFVKKGRKKKDERTSNRKSYDYGYEQH